MNYSPTAAFYRVRDGENPRHLSTRMALLMNRHGLRELEAKVLLSGLDMLMSQEFDQEAYSRDHYTFKMDLYVSELLKESTLNVKKAVKQNKYV